jgi:hypothetical protein
MHHATRLDAPAITGAGFHMSNAPDFSAYVAADYTKAVAGGMLEAVERKF